jgi:molecular chaperone GrpE (heat shock protein)
MTDDLVKTQQVLIVNLETERNSLREEIARLHREFDLERRRLLREARSARTQLKVVRRELIDAGHLLQNLINGIPK